MVQPEALLVQRGAPSLLAAPVEETALGMLALISLVWGASAPGFRWIFEMEHAPGALLVACLANLVALVTMLAQSASDGSWRVSVGKDSDGGEGLRGGVETGAWFYVGDLLMLAALTYTPASHASFIGQLCTVLVPCVQALHGAQVSGSIWSACLLAFAGCTMVLADSADHAAGGGMPATSLVGDGLALASAACFAAYAVRLEAVTKQASPASITVWSKATQAALGMACLGAAQLCGAEAGQGPLDFFRAATPAELGCAALFVLFNGVVSRGYVSLWQTEAFRVVSPSKAEVVFASTPLWSLFFAVAFLGEHVGPRLLGGIGLFLAALWLAMAPEQEAPPEREAERWSVARRADEC